MAQSDGHTNTLHRLELAIFREGQQIHSYKFAVNPEDYSETYKQRASVYKTRSQNVVDDFGPDIGQINFNGTTGWKRDRNGKTGKERLDELKDMIKSYAESGYSTQIGDTTHDELRFYNHTDGGAYRVHISPEGFEVTRSAQRSILYDYKIHLQILHTLDEPNVRDIDEALIGNTHSEYKTTSEVVNPNGSRPTHQGSQRTIDDITGVNSGRHPDRNYSNNNINNSYYMLYD